MRINLLDSMKAKKSFVQMLFPLVILLSKEVHFVK